MLFLRYKIVFLLFIALNNGHVFAIPILQYKGHIADIDTTMYKYLKVIELGYHPQYIISGTDTIHGKYYEFIEIKNTGTATIDLTSLALDSAVYYESPAGYLLPPGAFYVIATKTWYFYEKLVLPQAYLLFLLLITITSVPKGYSILPINPFK